MPNGELLTALAIATVSIIGAYLLNGWSERNLERRKTNYRAKLGHFEDANRILVRLFAVLIYARDILQEDPDSTDSKVLVATIMTHAALARDEETVLDSDVAERILDDLKAVSMLKEDDQEKGLDNWTRANYPGLVVLYLRLVTYHIHRFQSTIWNVQLVAETEQVLNGAASLIEMLLSGLHGLMEGPEPRGDKPQDRLKRVTSLEKDLRDLNIAFQRAMRHELELTLPPPRFPRKKGGSKPT